MAKGPELLLKPTHGLIEERRGFLRESAALPVQLRAQPAKRASSARKLPPVPMNGVHKSKQPLLRRTQAVPLRPGCAKLLEAPRHHGFGEFFLGFEVVVDIAYRHASRLGDVRQTRLSETAPIRQFRRSLNQPHSLVRLCRSHILRFGGVSYVTNSNHKPDAPVLSTPRHANFGRWWMVDQSKRRGFDVSYPWANDGQKGSWPLRESGSVLTNALLVRRSGTGSCFSPRQRRPLPMAKSKRKRVPKTVLKLPDLEQSKSAVLNSLTSSSSKRSYDHAIREFIDWYCSEPRLAFNRTGYRIALEQHPYAPSTINLRLAAIRRLAYEASDCGLLSPDLAAGIRRVKGSLSKVQFQRC